MKKCHFGQYVPLHGEIFAKMEGSREKASKPVYMAVACSLTTLGLLLKIYACIYERLPPQVRESGLIMFF